MIGDSNEMTENQKGSRLLDPISQQKSTIKTVILQKRLETVTNKTKVLIQLVIGLAILVLLFRLADEYKAGAGMRMVKDSRIGGI
jgi:hypothetical protein